MNAKHNGTRLQVRQSIVHVLNEWARAGNLWDERILSQDDFVSFTAYWPSDRTAPVAIKSARAYPLTLPNVARNVIAHEFGHALGLGHNSDPAMLMCGRPAPCRPDTFQAMNEHYFPLTTDEKALLLRLYRADWRSR